MGDDIEDMLEEQGAEVDGWKKRKDRVVLDLSYVQARILRGTINMGMEDHPEGKILDEILRVLDKKILLLD